MRARIFVWVYITGALLGLVVGSCGAQAEVYKLDLTYAKILNDRNPMLYEVESKDWGTAVTMEAGIQSKGKTFYIEPTFHFESCYSKICTAGLHIEYGARFTDSVALFGEHHSQHTLDRLNDSQSITRYPLYDAVGLRFSFIPKK